MVHIAIIRPINCLLTFFSVLVGAWIGKDIVVSQPLLIAGIVGILVCAYGNIVNDLYDIGIDKVNNPGRPLVAGLIKPQAAIIEACVILIVALVLSLFLGIVALALVSEVALILFFYAWYLKKTIAANLVVAFIAGQSFLLGGIVMHNIYSIIPFVFAMFIHLPREIVKDIHDQEGDRMYGVVSLPLSWGIERALRAGALFLVLLCIMLPLPFFLNIVGLGYLIVIACAYPVLIYVISQLVTKPRGLNLSRMSNLLKVSMAIGLFGMII